MSPRHAPCDAVPVVFRIGIPAGVALLVALAAAPAVRAAEYLRFELGADAARGVPRSYEELVDRVRALGVGISWQEPLTWDPGFSSSGGASYGSITCELGNADAVTVSWVEFSDPSAAVGYEREMTAAYGTSGYMRFVRQGRVIIQTYSHSGDPEPASAVLEAVVGG